MAHALLSASASERWLNCTPSARLTENIPDTSSVFAQEGTLAHSLGELELRKPLNLITDKDYKQELRAIHGHELFTEDMPGQVEKYTGYVFERMAEARAHTKDALVFLEQRLDFSKYVPEGFGTGDCVIIADNTLEIIDLKYGKGVEVSAERNTQMMLYALGALEGYGFIYNISTLRVSIVQPRLDNFSFWEMPVEDLITWADKELTPKAKEAYEGKGELSAGSWCKFCKARRTCKERARQALSVAEAYDMRSPNLLTDEEIAKVLKKAEELQSWAKDVQEYALEQARDKNARFPGWKLVEGRSNRKITDEVEAAKRMFNEGYKHEDIYKTALKGITDFEKLMGKKVFSQILSGLIIKPPGKPALVVEEDERPELDSAELDFDL